MSPVFPLMFQDPTQNLTVSLMLLVTLVSSNLRQIPRLSLFAIILSLLMSTGQLFCRMPFNSSDFPNDYIEVTHFGQNYYRSKVFPFLWYILSGSSWHGMSYSWWCSLCLISWWKWYLLGYSKLRFFLQELINISLICLIQFSNSYFRVKHQMSLHMLATSNLPF